MRHQALEAVDRLASAYEQVIQLRRTLDDLLHVQPEMHESWQYLLYDADHMQRRLAGALEAVGKVFLQDPTAYTRPPRWE